jgi:arginyl-tRNA synthetase
MKDRDIPEDKKNNTAKDIGIAAVVFSDLKNKRIKDIDFDVERALSYDTRTQSFKGESGPYLQYIHARLCSVLKKYGKVPDTNSSMHFLKEPQEFRILKSLYHYPDIIEDAANSNEPSILADYLLYIASLFSTYYQDKEKNRIVSDDEPLSAARIRMCLGLKRVLSGGLYLLGINAPEEM